MKIGIFVNNDNNNLKNLINNNIKNNFSSWEIIEIKTMKESGELVSTNKLDKAILVCDSSIDSFSSVIKFKGIRVAQVYSKEYAKSSRGHNDANILSLGTKYLNNDEIIEIINIFLKTDFSEEERHIRRINLIETERE